MLEAVLTLGCQPVAAARSLRFQARRTGSPRSWRAHPADSCRWNSGIGNGSRSQAIESTDGGERGWELTGVVR
eukprot:15450769-Alexandrium_andersonii.AAC.1